MSSISAFATPKSNTTDFNPTYHLSEQFLETASEEEVVQVLNWIYEV